MSNSLAEILGENKILKPWAAYLKLGQLLRSRWSDIFGKLADQVAFSHVQKDAVVVDVYNPMWVTELRHYESTVLKNIHDQTGHQVHHLVARYKPRPSAWPKRAPKGSNLTIEEKIRQRWRDAEDEGLKVCQSCKKRLTQAAECIVCRS